MEYKVDAAVLGLGAMGSRMAMNLVKAGKRVVVWNRSAGAADALVAAGAELADSPREAVAGAAFVMSMLRDDEASREVWLDSSKGALAAMEPGSVAIESSTLTPGWIRELGEAVAGRGLSLLEAPVSGSLPQAEAAQLVYLVGGDRETLSTAEPLLKLMGSSVQYAGPLGSGALVKLTTNALLGIQVMALAELIGMLRRSGADAALALEAVSKTSVWSPVDNYVSNYMLTDNPKVNFPIELLEKDFRYVLEAAGSTGSAPTIHAAHQSFLDAISKGLGKENMTSVAKLFTT